MSQLNYVPTVPADLALRWGDPEIIQGPELARAFVWEVDPSGDGVVFARADTRESESRRAHQLVELLDQVTEHARRPRWALLTLWCSGALAYEERPDLQYIDRVIRSGECAWVAFGDAADVARNTLCAWRFYGTLRSAGTSLFLASHDGFVDLERMQASPIRGKDLPSLHALLKGRGSSA